MSLSPALLVALQLWVHCATGLPMPPTPPRVEFVPIDTLQHISVERGNPFNSTRVVTALTLDPEHEVLLIDAWRDSNIEDVSWFVHELVHDAQMQAHAHYACRGAMEAEAYRVQDAWLRQHGSNLEAVTHRTPILQAELERCR